MTMAEKPSQNHPGATLNVADGIARLLGDRVLYHIILTRFHDDYRHGAAPLRAALAGDELRLANRIAHTLKGAAGRWRTWCRCCTAATARRLICWKRPAQACRRRSAKRDLARCRGRWMNLTSTARWQQSGARRTAMATGSQVASAGELGFFVETVGALLAAETTHAVERLLAIPARPFRRQALARAKRRQWRGDGRLGARILVRQTLLNGSQDFPFPAAAHPSSEQDYFSGIARA
jgi:hypothetical protein